MVPNCLRRLSTYRFHSGGEAGDTDDLTRSVRLKLRASTDGADRLIFGLDELVAAACFIATSPMTESLTVHRSSGSKEYAFMAAQLTSRGRQGAEYLIRYERHKENFYPSANHQRRERAGESN